MFIRIVSHITFMFLFLIFFLGLDIELRLRSSVLVGYSVSSFVYTTNLLGCYFRAHDFRCPYSLALFSCAPSIFGCDILLWCIREDIYTMFWKRWMPTIADSYPCLIFR